MKSPSMWYSTTENPPYPLSDKFESSNFLTRKRRIAGFCLKWSKLSVILDLIFKLLLIYRSATIILLQFFLFLFCRNWFWVNQVLFVITQCLALLFFCLDLEFSWTTWHFLWRSWIFWKILNFLPRSWQFFLLRNQRFFLDFFPWFWKNLQNLTCIAKNNCQNLSKKSRRSKSFCQENQNSKHWVFSIHSLHFPGFELQVK